MNERGNDQQIEKQRVWYAIQTFYCKEEHLGKFLEERGINYFIPMRYTEQETLDGKKHRKLTPAVHNLLFVEKTFTEKEFLEKIEGCPIPFLIIRDRSTRQSYEIPDKKCWNCVLSVIRITKELSMLIQQQLKPAQDKQSG